MARVVISSEAESDLLEIYLFVGRRDRSPGGAARLLRAIGESCAAHAEQPLMGAARPDFGDGIRTFLCGAKSNPVNWIVFYRPIEKGIEVIRVFHTKQNYPDLF